MTHYATAGSSYTKAESGGRYQGKGNYQPAGNYALVGAASYIKAESDGKYQPKGSYQASGYSYSKSESDGKYQPKGNYATDSNVVKGIRLSAIRSLDLWPNNEGKWNRNNGEVLIDIFRNRTSGMIDTVKYASIQHLINGTWVTVKDI